MQQAPPVQSASVAKESNRPVTKNVREPQPENLVVVVDPKPAMMNGQRMMESVANLDTPLHPFQTTVS